MAAAKKAIKKAPKKVTAKPRKVAAKTPPPQPTPPATTSMPAARRRGIQPGQTITLTSGRTITKREKHHHGEEKKE